MILQLKVSLFVIYIQQVHAMCIVLHFFQVGGRRYQATTAGQRAEGGEGQSQGKFFPGWRAEGGGRSPTQREVLTSL